MEGNKFGDCWFDEQFFSTLRECLKAELNAQFQTRKPECRFARTWVSECGFVSGRISQCRKIGTNLIVTWCYR